MCKAICRVVACLSLAALAGCTPNAAVGVVQTSNTYPNKVRLKTLVYVPDEVQNRLLTCSPSSYACSAWKSEITTGEGYKSAIVNGLAAALLSVQTVDSAPTPEMAQREQADLLVTTVLSNENANITVNEGFWQGSINTQFQAAVTLNFSDSAGQSLYSYTANGAGFGNQSGDCNKIAPALKTSVEGAMKQIADYIAQSTFGAAPIRDYEKTVAPTQKR
jgi:hypothetical protein